MPGPVCCNSPMTHPTMLMVPARDSIAIKHVASLIAFFRNPIIRRGPPGASKFLPMGLSAQPTALV